MEVDRIFDGMSQRFHRNLYGTIKGRVRLEVLWRAMLADMPQLQQEPLTILDAGAGQGQVAALLAKQGHHLTLLEPSAEMLQMARDNFSSEGLEAEFIRSRIQDADLQVGTYDVVLCHAVIEWLADPGQVLRQLVEGIKPGGYLSLLFYNVHALRQRHMIWGNFDKVLAGELKGDGRKRFTPTNPQDYHQVRTWLAEAGLEEVGFSGVRVFVDYMSRELRYKLSEAEADKVLAMELEFSRREPYCYWGRYLHLTARRPL